MKLRDIQPHHAMVAIVMAGSLGLIGIITVNHIPAAQPPHIARVQLPRGQCPRPTDGSVLHITVAEQAPGTGEYHIHCSTVAPRQRMPAHQGAPA
jgi:hypothetical protein